VRDRWKVTAAVEGGDVGGEIRHTCRMAYGRELEQGGVIDIPTSLYVHRYQNVAG
jgi:hypothetical protein